MSGFANQPRKIAACVVAMQAVILWLAFTIALFLINKMLAFSLLAGGLCALIPSILYTVIVFARTKAQDARRIVVALYAGEFLKLILGAVMVVLALVWLKLQLAYVLAGFILTLFSFFIAPLVGLVKLK